MVLKSKQKLEQNISSIMSAANKSIQESNLRIAARIFLSHFDYQLLLQKYLDFYLDDYR